MRFVASRLILLATAVLSVNVLVTPTGWADENKPSTEAAVTKSNESKTNLPSFNPKPDGLKQLEQDLFKPFEKIAPESSLDGVFLPTTPEPRPATPAIQSKRVKELLERRRDWVFETPDEILATSSAEEILKSRDNLKDDDDKAKLSPLERFYERLYNKDKKDTTRKVNKREGLHEAPKPGALGDDAEREDDSDLPLGVRETQREMRKLLAPKESKTETSSDTGRSGFSDVFGLTKNPQTRDELEIQKERRDRYKELVGLPVTPTLENDPLKRFREIMGTAPPNASLLPSMDTLGGKPQQNLFGAQSGSASALPSTSLLPEGAKVYTPSSLTPALPKIEPPRTLPPPVTFGAPRRAF